MNNHFTVVVLVFLKLLGAIMYKVIEFNEEDGGGLAVVHSEWLTPRKKEVFWPPLKDNQAFSRALKRAQPSEENWKLFSINKIYYETDDFEKAYKNLRRAEVTSDLGTEPEDSQVITTKRIRKPRRLSSNSEEESENFGSLLRPPRIHYPSQKAHFSGSGVSISSSEGMSTGRKLNNETLVFSQQILDREENNISPLCNTPIRNTSVAVHNTSVASPVADSASSLAFQKKILSTLMTIKQQNDQILARFNEKDLERIRTLPPTLPTELPLKTNLDITQIEAYLNERTDCVALSGYLASLGGTGVSSRVNRILRECMTDELACNYNFIGSRQNKLLFSKLKLSKCVICAVKLGEPEVSDRSVEDSVKNWLKHAPQRLKFKRNRRTVMI